MHVAQVLCSRSSDIDIASVLGGALRKRSRDANLVQVALTDPDTEIL